jgi:hypothetical protein
MTDAQANQALAYNFGPYPERARTVDVSAEYFGAATLVLVGAPFLGFGLYLATHRLFAPATIICLVLGAGMLLGAAAIVRLALQAKRRLEDINLYGIRCWGLILNSRATGAGQRSGALTWHGIEFELELYDAKRVDAGQHHVTGQRISPTLTISALQMSLVQPGGWMALLVDPRDAKHAHLDALRSIDGRFVVVQ